MPPLNRPPSANAVFHLRSVRSIPLFLSLIIAVLLVLAQEPATAAAQRTGLPPELFAAEGAAGGQFNASGTRFASTTQYTLQLVTGRTFVPLGDVVSGANGDLGPTPLTIPGNIAPGQYDMQALNATGGVEATSQLTVREPITLNLTPASGPPGSNVQVSVENLAAGMLQLKVGGNTVIGPAPVRGTSYDGVFKVPAQAGATASAVARVEVINSVGSLVVGTGDGQFDVVADTSPTRYEVRNAAFAQTDLVPGDPFLLTGSLNPPPTGPVSAYQITPFWQDEDGTTVPLSGASADLTPSGALQVRGQVPSLVKGDAFTGNANGSLGLQIVAPGGVSSQLFPAKDALRSFGSFKVTVVKDMPGTAQDGMPIPNLPVPGPGEGDPLQVTIEPLGSFTTTLGETLILSGTEPLLDADAVVNTLTSHQAFQKGIQILDKFVNCIKLVDQQADLKWWEWVIDPYDTIILGTSNDQLFNPGVDSQIDLTVPQQLTTAVAGDGQSGETAMLLIYRVTVDASRVQDGGQDGYGFVNELGFAIPTEKMFVWVPVHDLIFEIDEEALTATQMANPAPIALPPLPPGWKSKLALKDVKIDGFHVPPYEKDLSNPTFDGLYSFIRPSTNALNPSITFNPVAPMRLEVYLSNFGYDATQVDATVMVKVDGVAYPVIKEELPQEEEQKFSCYESDVQLPDEFRNSVWVANIPNPHEFTFGSHDLEIMVSDGINTTDSTSGAIIYKTYPSWFDDLPLSGRTVEWGPAIRF